MEMIDLINKLGYPIAVSIWFMWFVSAYASRIQRLIEWAIATKHQIDNIELMLQQLYNHLQHTTHNEE